MTFLTMLGVVLLCGTVAMAMLELMTAWGAPPFQQITCNCRSPHFSKRHLIRPLILTLALLCLATGTYFTLAFGVEPTSLIFVAMAGWHLNRWRKHPKDKNRHPLGRILAVIRETAAGLKIVPQPAGGRA